MHIFSKKLILSSIGVLISLGVITGFFLIPSSEKNDRQSAFPKVSRKALYEGISKNLETLSEDDQLNISMLIPGNLVEENVWSFSGTLKGNSADRPFYGQITLTCQIAETHACWKLKRLVIDGHPYTLANDFSEPSNELLPEEKENSVISNVEPVQQNEPAQKITDDQPDGEKQNITQQPKKVVTSLDLPSKVPATQKEEPDIFQTVSDNVNARMGPGDNFDIAFKMPSSVSLTLIDENTKWGKFEYKGANNQIGQVWIALALVKKKN